jgi:transposase
MAATTRRGARERLAGLPDAVSARQIADALGVSISAVRNWIKDPQWPQHTEKVGKERRYPTAAVADFLDQDTALARGENGQNGAEPAPAPLGLDGGSVAMLTLPQIAVRTGRNPKSVSAYPSLYGPDSNDPFPPADDLGRRRERDVAAWFSRRNSRTGRRLPPTEPPAPVSAPAASDLIDVPGIIALTRRDPEAVNSFVRRPEIAAASIGKVGRNRAWPRQPMIQMLCERGYLTDVSGIAALTGLDSRAAREAVSRPEIAALRTGKDGRKDLWPREAVLAVLRELGYQTNAPTADERRWRASGTKSKTELAAHYGVTVGAITKRMERASAGGDPRRRPPAPVDPDAARPMYDAEAFDDFWRTTA